METTLSKFHHSVSAAAGLLFLAVFQQLSFPAPIFRLLVPATLCGAVALWAYVSRYLRLHGAYRSWVAVRPSLLLLAGASAAFVVPGGSLRAATILGTAAAVWISTLLSASYSESLLLSETLLAALGFSLAATGLNQYFPPLNTWCLAAVFGAFLALSRAFVEFAPHGEREKLVGSVLIALLCAEFFWVLSFLPLHFSATGTVLFAAFYCCLMLTYHHLYGTLTGKKVQFYLVFVAVCAAIATLVSPWNPIS